MNLLERIVNKTHKILRENEIFAKKKFGQNFLISQTVLDDTIRKSSINENSYVIEIGTGLGSLTEYLALNAKKVLTYEIDPDMYAIAKVNLSNYHNIEMVLKDFLDTNIDEDIDNYLDANNDIIVIANIPYYITTPIAFKLLECSRVKDIYLMMQAELADRFKALPKTKEYNSLSALIAYKGSAKRVLSVSRNCFYPVPNVDSILLNIKVDKIDYGVKNEPCFMKYLKDVFSAKRKTVVNNISSTRGIEKTVIQKVLLKLGFSETTRAEELDIVNLVKIYKELFEKE